MELWIEKNETLNTGQSIRLKETNIIGFIGRRIKSTFANMLGTMLTIRVRLRCWKKGKKIKNECELTLNTGRSGVAICKYTIEIGGKGFGCVLSSRLGAGVRSVVLMIGGLCRLTILMVVAQSIESHLVHWRNTTNISLRIYPVGIINYCVLIAIKSSVTGLIKSLHSLKQSFVLLWGRSEFNHQGFPHP